MIVIVSFLTLVMSCSLFSGGEEATNTNENLENAEANTENAATPATTKKAAPKDKNVKVKFSTGKTLKSYSSSIAKGGNHAYSLSASKGQVMKVEITSKNNNAKFKVIGAGGGDIRGYASSSYSGTLPANGNYRIVVTSDTDVSYKVNFNVSALVKAYFSQINDII